MTTAALLLAAGDGSRFAGPGHKLAAAWGHGTVVASSLANMVHSGLDRFVVVSGSAGSTAAVEAALEALAGIPGVDHIRHIVNPAWTSGLASSLQIGIEAVVSLGCDSVVVGLADQPAVPGSAWRTVAEVATEIGVARFGRGVAPPVFLQSTVWPLLPTDGDAGARTLIATRPDLVTEVLVAGDPRDVDTVEDLLSEEDRCYIETCLGRPPRCRYTVAARAEDGRPMVIANEPFLDDGTPMPTRYWLIDPDLNRRLGTLEAARGVDRAEAEIDDELLAANHRRYAVERDALIAADHVGPRPSGGVGGTRVGVKCLHTHVAHLLAGGDDPVGRWAMAHLHDDGHGDSQDGN